MNFLSIFLFPLYMINGPMLLPTVTASHNLVKQLLQKERNRCTAGNL